MNTKPRIGIVAWGSSSPLGGTPVESWEAYLSTASSTQKDESLGSWVASIATSEENHLQELRKQNRHYQRLDRSVLLAILAAERALTQSKWKAKNDIGLYLGSSRGATGSWETYHQDHQKGEQLLPPHASPLSTAGNLATHTAQHLGLHGFSSDNSITCSSALHALANAMVWLESGRYQRFLAGGAEAPLTPFTLAQMKALKIYASDDLEGPYPNRSLELDKSHNTMILGEGSTVFALERDPQQPIAWIRGLGYSREDVSSLTSVSQDGIALQTAMRQALKEAQLQTVDAIVCHSPGTRKGDQSEYAAITAVFGKNIPSLTSNKWKIGHTLGASGGLSLELALLMLQEQSFVPVPYLTSPGAPNSIRYVMVNALGFGGNAISIIIEKSAK